MPSEDEDAVPWDFPTAGAEPAHSDRTRGDLASALAGRPLLYRLGFASNVVFGQPEEVTVHGVRFEFTRGPIRTQWVEMQQRTPPPLVWDKCMHRGVEVGRGRYVTLCKLAATVEPNTPFWLQFRGWREHVLSAAGLLATVWDERYFGDEVLEDALMPHGDGVAVLDRGPWVREYAPRAISAHELEPLKKIRDVQDDPVATTAARWYLKAAREGPSADAIVSFWIALEALGEVDKKNERRIRVLMEDAGLAIEEPDLPTIGRLYGLRSAIVHNGVEKDPLIEKGFVVLEAVTRAILRKRVGAESWWSWPFFVGDPNVVGSPEDLALLQEAYENPAEEWHVESLPTPPPLPPPPPEE
jgi:hypothetical protein